MTLLSPTSVLGCCSLPRFLFLLCPFVKEAVLRIVTRKVLLNAEAPDQPGSRGARERPRPADARRTHHRSPRRYWIDGRRTPKARGDRR